MTPSEVAAALHGHTKHLPVSHWTKQLLKVADGNDDDEHTHAHTHKHAHNTRTRRNTQHAKAHTRTHTHNMTPSEVAAALHGHTKHKPASHWTKQMLNGLMETSTTADTGSTKKTP